MLTTHPIPATFWQLRVAAQGRLNKIVLPLTGGWFEGDPSGWPSIEDIEVGFKEGDRIYLQEEWGWDNGSYFTKSEAIAKEITQGEIESWVWHPASVMSSEVAYYWFEVMGVKVARITDLDLRAFFDSGLSDTNPVGPLTGLAVWDCSEMAAARWNAAYPKQTWECDRWVVVLEVEAVLVDRQ